MLTIESIKEPLLNSTELLFCALSIPELTELYSILVKYIEYNDLREMNEKRMVDSLIEPLDRLNLIPKISAIALKFAMHVDIDSLCHTIAICLVPEDRARNQRFAKPNEIKSILESDHVLLYLTVLILYIDVLVDNIRKYRGAKNQ